jgi:tetratricopeptide (TPR) repeat protein
VVAAAGAGPVIAWALNKDAFTQDGVPLAVRESAATTFGLLLAAMLAVLLAAGLGVGFRAARRAPSARIRRRAGVAAIAVGASLPLLAFAGVAFSDRGIGGTLSDLTNENASVSGGPDRLTQSSSSRAKYWGEAFDVFGENTFKGTGANTFGVSRLPHREDELVARHAHGFVAQTASDLGLLGLLAAFALAGAWLAAVARALGVRRGGRSTPFDAERVGVIALALSALVFGLQSIIDWTWSVPGPSVMAIVAAGFVAGRGPLPALTGGARAPEPAGLPLEAETTELPAAQPGLSLRRPSTERLVAVGLVLAAVAVTAWTAWQPARADDASNHALALLDDGKLSEAAREADRAYDLNPLTPKPLFVKAQVQQRAGNLQAASGTLERAVVEHSAEPEVWLRLATFELRVLDRPQAALDTLRGALYLDPRSRAAQTTFFDARVRLREQETARAGS